MTSTKKRELNIMSLAGPVIVGNLLWSLVGFSSIKIVSQLGQNAIESVIGAERVFLTVQCLFIVVSGGTAAMVAQFCGAKARNNATQCLKLSLLLTILIGALLSTAVYFFATMIVQLFKLDEATIAGAALFLRTVSLFFIPFGVAQIIATALRASGDARTPLWIFGSANVLNIALLYGLVYGFWRVPSLGIRGAALANGISYTTSAALFLLPWMLDRLALSFRGGSFFNFGQWRMLLRIGLPAAVEQFLFQVGLLLMMFIVSLLGATAFAAYGVGVYLMSFSFVIGTGFSVATATIVGQYVGAGDILGARSGAWRTSAYAMASMFALGLVVNIFGHPIGRFLGLAPATQAALQVFLVVLALVQPLMALEFSLAGALRGAGDTRTTMLFTFLGLFCGRLLVAGVFYLLGFGLVWVFSALIVDYALKASLYVHRMRGDLWAAPVIKTLNPASSE